MIFICKEDFFAKAAECERLPRESEKAYALQMRAGDGAAREKIICSYLPVAAAFVRRCCPDMQTLEFIYRVMVSLEKAVDSFDFQQEGETFLHRLGTVFRATVTRYIADL